MVRHTPGPWTWHEQGDANAYCLLAGKNWVLGLLQNGELMPERQRANARLIAAAPELLAALQALTARIEASPRFLRAEGISVVAELRREALSLARRAVDKATAGAP